MGITNSTQDGVSDSGPEQPKIPNRRTPAFTAVHGLRYKRQELIGEINRRQKSQLICCVGGQATTIRREDIVFLRDLLHNIERGTPIDLMLHTPGGDVDAAEKFARMISEAAGTSNFRVIVPDYAKSAGTLIALGADSIVMSDSSELGPIDPQIVTVDRAGIVQVVAIQNHLEAFQEFSQKVNKDPDDHASRAMLDKFDPARIHQYRAAKERARALAEKLLSSRMCRDGDGRVTAIAGTLMDARRYPSHGQMIGYVEAEQIGLQVDYLSPSDPSWDAYWQLFCYQRVEVPERSKLFESNWASLLTPEEP